MSRFAVLMYHRIHSAETPVDDARERPWAVTLDAFQEQMGHLVAAGRMAVSMAQAHAELAAGRRVPAEWVVLTFDDGNQSDHRHALPVLSRLGFRATFFVCGYRVGARDGLSPGDIKEMHDAGMHIGSHAMTHRFLTTLSPREEDDELARSQQLLQEIVMTAVDHFAPPGGRWSSRTAGALRRLSYRAVSTSQFGYNDASKAAFAYRRIPMVAATTAERFDTIASGSRWRLWPSYARATSVGMVRRALGESAYARMRGYGDA